MAGGLGDMSSLLKQAQGMQKKMQSTEKELSERVVEGSSGGGIVKVYINGLQELQAVKIGADAVDPDDIETLEDLVTAAFRQALVASKDLRQKEMSKVTGGMNLPGLGF